jgi:hypothetical protein
MFRFVVRLPVIRLALVFAAGCLLSGCASFGSEPLTPGVAKLPRSIKDDAADVAAQSLPKTQPQPTPKRPRIVARPASGPNVPACEGGRDCASLLKSLIEGPNRAWVGQPQSPADHATGTRLFAYRALRGRLSCPELATARAELEGAAAAFKAPIAGVSATDAKRVLALNAAVNAELRAEQQRRCRG